MIILHMPRRTPALYLWAARMRLRNRRARSRIVPPYIDLNEDAPVVTSNRRKAGT